MVSSMTSVCGGLLTNMKILFVCLANVGRSQMAAAFYNQITGTSDASSAGVRVEKPGETLGERRARRGGTYLLQIMLEEEGIDLGDSEQTQLTEDMLDGNDQIISMAQQEYTPGWLSEHPNYVSWDIEDPGGKDYAHTQKAKEEVKAHVRDFVQNVS